MVDLHPFILLASAVGVGALLWRLRARQLRRKAWRRYAGYELMDALKAYTVWIDWRRDEPLLHQSPEELSIPAVLARAVQVKDQHFPELSALFVELLHTHRELMQYLWEQNILRMTHAVPVRPHYADPVYHAIRDRQDAVLDSLFSRCRELIGDDATPWRRTRSDFSFSSSSMGAPSLPSTP